MTACIQMANFMSYTQSNMYIYTPLCRYWIALYRHVLVFIVPHVDIELEDNKQFISNIPRIPVTEQTRNLFQTKQREISPKVRKPELSFLYPTRCLVLFYISTKYLKNIPKGLTYKADTKSMDNNCQI